MKLLGLSLATRSPWRTPWHADTLMGSLCWACVRSRGAADLRRLLIDPMLAGEPPFVLSDAFALGLLPAPLWLRLVSWPVGTDLKAIKRRTLLDFDGFADAIAGEVPPIGSLHVPPFRDHERRHNTLSRHSNASQEGGLFSVAETVVLASGGSDGSTLDLYARVRDQSAADLLLDLFNVLSLSGFGADTSTGRGSFRITDARVEAEARPDGANGVLCLSTFQPAPGDPTRGLWLTNTTFGKLGPGLGVTEPRKYPLIMLRPGACFVTDPSTPFLGRALAAEAFLPPRTCDELRSAEVRVCHPAFGLCVPACIPENLVTPA